MQSVGDREKGSGEEKPSALDVWVTGLGGEAPSPAAAWQQRAHLMPGGGGEPRTRTQVETRALH